MSNKKTTWDYVYVITQFALFAAYLLEMPQLQFDLPIGGQYLGLMLAVVGVVICILALLQLNTNLSPFPTPLATSQLVRNGVYALARHPIYTGILLGTLGYGLFTGSGYRLLLSAGLAILFYFKSSYEEKLLLERYPDYSAYKKTTGRFLPGL